MIKHILLALILCVCASQANAASRFWVGGTGTWDAATTTNWSATSGGAGGASVPASTDDVYFDGLSGGGTVTVNTTVIVNSIDMSAFTGTLDFSVHNNNVTLAKNSTTGYAFNCSGTSVRGLNMGNGTWTITGRGNNIVSFATTNLTFNANNSTLVATPASAPTNYSGFNLGGLTFRNITLNSGGFNAFARTFLTGGTIGTLTINGGVDFYPNNPITVSTALVVNGTSSNNVATIATLDGGTQTLTLSGTATINWAAIGGITFTGSPVANNSFDLGGNSGITINGPSGGGGGHIIGG